ncbi:GGDEF domain-containing protein [Lacimicrobium alkaliphilum]|uniref:diguanylate cyclase n=1 Tax=Lacimicrobium alkaliphilum TaxID=1526571 RepID=A0A0U2PIP1_9ALTE|nr:GGDEF domain-containing protein [Lacimicrobium alkaliphilum]ALS99373.1 diguanylate cyclase [Lacimicrobium alkaliphilum]
MNFSLLKLHPRMLLVSFSAISLAVILSFSLGELKSWQQIDWLDVVGEGGIVLLTIVWQLFLLISRPSGRVTTLLTIGLCCFMFSSLLDALDEFIHYPEHALLPLFESVPAPFGMILMTWGLYQWHQEMLTLNAQLRRREAGVREHDEVDLVTRLYRADYMREQISQSLIRHQAGFCVAVVDIDQFDAFNRRFGHGEGDRLLREVAELILMNVRQTDLVCRYAGDRFILLMPQLPLKRASQQVHQIANAVKHLAFKTGNHAVFHTLSTAVVEAAKNEPCDALLMRLNQQLEKQKASIRESERAPLCYAPR